MLRTLALHVSSLRARLTKTPSEVQLSDKVRALGEDIGRQTMAPDPIVAAASGGEAMPTLERRCSCDRLSALRRDGGVEAKTKRM